MPEIRMPEVRATKTEKQIAAEVEDFAKNSKTSTITRMGAHVLQKGWQSGSLLFSAVVGPALVYQSGGNWDLLFQTAGKGGVAGICVAGLLGAVKLTGEPMSNIEDRVYKLRYNELQKRCDLFSGAGAVTGLGVALAQRKPEWTAWDYVGYAAVGAAAGVVAHSVTAPDSLRQESKAGLDSLNRNLQDTINKMA